MPLVSTGSGPHDCTVLYTRIVQYSVLHSAVLLSECEHRTVEYRYDFRDLRARFEYFMATFSQCDEFGISERLVEYAIRSNLEDFGTFTNI